MLSYAMQNIPGVEPRTTLTTAQREEALDLFERGLMNGAQIARHLGVGRHVVYRYFKAVGAVEGRFLHEHMLRQHAEIDARQHARRMQQRADEQRRLDASARRDAMVGRFIAALVEADRQGRLVEFGKRLPRL